MIGETTINFFTAYNIYLHDKSFGGNWDEWLKHIRAWMDVEVLHFYEDVDYTAFKLRYKV